MVLVKIFNFSLSLFFFKIALNIPFDYLQDRKQPFLDYKKITLLKSEGVDPWFWSKFYHFLSVFFFFK